MITLRRSEARGHASHGWLDSRHTFSFADYHDPAHRGFRTLRVINEDRVAPGQGFGAHPHRDMEIITYVLEGALEHRDNMGHRGVIRPDMIQRMSAGTGVEHAEYNASATEPVHFMQIWILPSARGVAPRYEDRALDSAGAENRLQLLVSPDGADGSLDIHQDARLYRARLDAGARVTHALAPTRHAWLQILRGSVTTNGVELHTGDAAAISDESTLTLTATSPAELLLFDLS